MSLSRAAPLRRGKPLKRTAPMRRTWMKKKPARRIAKRKGLRAHLAFVAKMSCAGEYGISIAGRGWRDHRCSGPIQVAHLGPKPGMGMKCPDDETGPLCMGLHADLDQHAGPFRGWSRSERREWCDAVIAGVRLAMTPDNRDHARDLEAAGLGWVEAREDGTWTWNAGERTEVAA